MSAFAALGLRSLGDLWVEYPGGPKILLALLGMGILNQSPQQEPSMKPWGLAFRVEVSVVHDFSSDCHVPRTLTMTGISFLALHHSIGPRNVKDKYTLNPKPLCRLVKFHGSRHGKCIPVRSRRLILSDKLLPCTGDRPCVTGCQIHALHPPVD